MNRAAIRAMPAILLGGLFLLVLSSPGAAMFMRLHESVPVDRLIANLGRFVEDNPDDPHGHYTLGRVHSLAYAKASTMPGPHADEDDASTVEVIPPRRRHDLGQPGAAPPELPAFPPYQSIQQGPRPEQSRPQLPDDARDHLLHSIRHYDHATRLDPERALYWLGYGWMLEQAHRHHLTPQLDQPQDPDAAQRDADAPEEPAEPPGDEPADEPRNGQDEADGEHLARDMAMDAYRRAVELSVEDDLAQPHHLVGGDRIISLEATENLLRLLEETGPGGVPAEEHREEHARLLETQRRLEQVPMAITPIIVPLTGELARAAVDGSRGVEALLDDSRRVRFDLAGDGIERDWPWLRPGVGLLVWDPQKTGRVESGRQLFGSTTWWSFWRDGYEPLAALDDDGDGWLTGDELAGLAIWHDANGNGISDPGEVRPVSDWGIVAINVRAESHDSRHVLAWSDRGVIFEDGSVHPTFDWQPVGSPVARSEAASAQRRQERTRISIRISR